MPLIETKGAASAQGFGGAGAGASGPVTYIEDVFSTWLYTGNGSTQTITNGIDLSGKGGLVWIKSRSAAFDHYLMDTLRGGSATLFSNLSSGSINQPATINSFDTTGFSLGNRSEVNQASNSFVSWTFREQPKFFDIVTYTGNGSTSGRTISHNLGSVPGCIIVKKTSSAEDWYVYHRSLGNTGTLQYFCILNSTAAQDTGGFGMEKASNWTATQFALASGTSALNTNGATYVAYLFAHNAGGFGLTGTDNVISCGSYTGSSSPFPVINLGYEPQWVLIKRTDSGSANDWMLFDNMRGFGLDSIAGYNLKPNLSNAEQNAYTITPTATSFSPTTNGAQTNGAGATYIYIAIRRGPMKVPTSGTSVFAPVARAGTGSSPVTTSSFGFRVDAYYTQSRIGNIQTELFDRLRGGGVTGLQTTSTNAEGNRPCSVQFNTTQTAIQIVVGTDINNGNPYTYIDYAFQRAPGFFDEVCYTGNGSTQNQSHNLAVVPELMIVKARDLNFRSWAVYFGDNSKAMSLNDTTASRSFAGWNYTTPTTSVFSLGADSDVNSSGYTYVAYLFATCAGVSKVGSYTGTGALQTINCGFTGGSRFVLIKRTDSTGDWYIYDSARGISSGNDPYLLLNDSGAEVTGTNYVDTTSVGFQVTAAAPAGLNANGGTYIFLAIA